MSLQLVQNMSATAISLSSNQDVKEHAMPAIQVIKCHTILVC